jgi:serine protease AprX
LASDHPDEFLLRERRDIEFLAEDYGDRVVRKLDRVLVREILYERRQAAADRMFCIPRSARRHHVAITMRAARQDRSAAQARWRNDRRRMITELRRSAELSLSRLIDECRERCIDIEERYWIAHTAIAHLTAEEIRHVAMRHDVATVYAVKERLLTQLDESRPLIGADVVAGTLGFDGSGITVAVLDTGVDATHPALAAVVINQTDLTGAGGGIAEGIGDFVGHGTHCAGIVASQDARFRGIAPGAAIDDIKILRSDGMGGGTGTLASAQAGLQQAVANGDRIASCSWGFSHKDGAWQDPPTPEADDGTCPICISADNAVTAGVVVVVAAGNDDEDTCATYDTHIGCPGLARLVITVAASDKDDDIAGFSSVGPTPRGRQKPDITAPGEEIVSCLASGVSFGDEESATFTSADGTSMATPHIAGVAALMLDKTPALTPAQVANILMSTAIDLGEPPESQGTGRVNAVAAVNSS